MKKSIKTAIFVSAVAAASLGGLKAYDLNMRSDVSNSDLLLIENLTALTEGKTTKSSTNCGQTVRVRAAHDGACYRPRYSTCACTDPIHVKIYECYFSNVDWDFDHSMYRCFNMPVERYLKEKTWTASFSQDEECNYIHAKNQPESQNNHIITAIKETNR